MFVRAIVLLLLALNIAAGLWLWLAPTAAQPALPATDPGVTALTLLGERLASLSDDAAELATAPEPPPAAGPDPTSMAQPQAAGEAAEGDPSALAIASPAPPIATRCFEVGPFQTQAELRNAETVLSAVGRPLDSREATERRFRGYWVYLPASASRSEALETARALATAGVRDYYVVTAGDRENTISLGLFRDRANAERRQAEMRTQGYQAELNERVEEQNVYWLGLEAPVNEEDAWRSLLTTPHDLQAASISCPL